MASWYSRICVWLIVSCVIVTQKRCSCSVFPLLLPRSPGFLKCLFSNAQHGQEAPSVLVSDVQYERAFGVITTTKETVWQKKIIVPFSKTNQSGHYVWPRQAASWWTRPTRLLSMWTRDPFSTDGRAQRRAQRRGSDLPQTAARSSPLCRQTSAIHLGRQAGAKAEKDIKVKLVMQPGLADRGGEGLFFCVILMSWVRGGMTHRELGKRKSRKPEVLVVALSFFNPQSPYQKPRHVHTCLGLMRISVKLCFQILSVLLL